MGEKETKKERKISKTRSLKDDRNTSDVRSRPKSYHGQESVTALEDERELMQEILQQLPSRQLATQARFITGTDTISLRTLKHRLGLDHMTSEGHVSDDVIDHMAADILLHDENNMDALPEDLKVTEIRDRFSSASLTRKKKIKNHLEAKLQEGSTKHRKKQKRASASPCMCFTVCGGRLKRSFETLRYTFALWHSHFKVIEGKFGTGVASYFYFLRFLLLLNIPAFIMLLAFVIIPQILETYIGPGSPYDTDPSYQAQDFFVGTGWMESTELFYGYYTNQTINVMTSLKYYMTFAYLFTMAGFYLLVLIVAMISLSRSYQKNYVDGTDTVHLYYVTKVFCGWDFSVNSLDTARLNHKAIFKELQEYLSSTLHLKPARTISEWGKVLVIRLILNLVVLVLLAGSGYLVWYLATTQVLDGTETGTLRFLALPLAISALNFILPFVFSVITSAEMYTHPQTELVVSMLRSTLLILTTLAVLVAFLFTTVDCSQVDNDSRFIDSKIPCQICWETFVGQQFYRLVIIDFFFIIGSTLIAEFFRSLLAKTTFQALHKPEFNIAQNTLSLIYSQILIWLGTFYSPFLAFIMIIKLIIIFYFKRLSVTVNCVSPVKPWRGGRTHTIILTLMFISYLLTLFCVGYSIAFLTPSETCGPYSGKTSMYALISDALEEWRQNDEGVNNVLSVIVEIITSFFFLVALFITLVVVAHWSRVVSHGHQDMVDLLKHQINLEGKDKKFLLSLLLYTKEKRLSSHETG